MKYSAYLESLEEIFKKALMKAIIEGVAECAPFLVSGIWGIVLNKIVEKIVAIIIKQGKLRAFYAMTDIRVNQQGKRLIEAMEANRKAQETGTVTKEIEDEFEKALVDFITLSK